MFKKQGTTEVFKVAVNKVFNIQDDRQYSERIGVLEEEEYKKLLSHVYLP